MNKLTKESNVSSKRSLEEVLKYFAKPRNISWPATKIWFKSPNPPYSRFYDGEERAFLFVPGNGNGTDWEIDISVRNIHAYWPKFIHKIKIWYKTVYNPQTSTGKAVGAKVANNQPPKWYTKLPDGPYGKIFADEQRSATNVLEPNTTIESNLIDRIFGHLSNSRKLDNKDAEQLKSILEKGLYADIIKPPKSPEVVRGMALDAKTFSNLIKMPLNKINFVGSIKPNKPIIYKPINGGASSWSKDRKVAKNFANESQDPEIDRFVIVYLYANTVANSNRFFDFEAWYKEIDDEFAHEKEVVGLGQINVTRIEWEIAGSTK